LYKELSRFIFCSEKEVRLYTLLKKFQVEFTECPYSSTGYRHHVQEMLNDFEYKFKGTKQGIVNSFLDILPLLKEKEKGNSSEIQLCKKCDEPTNKEVCNACTIKEVVEIG